MTDNNLVLNTYSQFVCLSGLPRSGSTLLSAILSQNPLIHAEGNSAVCQLMWDMQMSCLNTSREQLLANNRENTVYELISQIPRIYYKNINEKIVVDKCRSWTLEPNFHLLKNYIDKNIKIIVLERKVIDVVKSFIKLYRKNGLFNEEIENRLVLDNSEPIMRSLNGIKWAKKNNLQNNFLFINYDELIENTENIISKIYEFCGWEHFTHDFNNIQVKYPENDKIYNLLGQHEIRPNIKKEINDIELNPKLKIICEVIDNNHTST